MWPSKKQNAKVSSRDEKWNLFLKAELYAEVYSMLNISLLDGLETLLAGKLHDIPCSELKLQQNINRDQIWKCIYEYFNSSKPEIITFLFVLDSQQNILSRKISIQTWTEAFTNASGER